MKRSRQILVLTLVATALCADRVATAAPQFRATTADPIARLATNLAARMFRSSFRRETPAVRLQPTRREDGAVLVPKLPVVPPTVFVRQVESSPFQFRLPPPSP